MKAVVFHGIGDIRLDEGATLPRYDFEQAGRTAAYETAARH